MKDEKYIYGEKSDKPKEPRTPIEDPNTLQSRAVAKFVDLISEGEIEGLVNGEESVYFNNIPIRDGENSYNYQGASYEFKPGSPDGVSLRDYPTSESEISVDIHVVKTVGSIVRAITDTDVDDLRLTFTIPSLFSVNSKNGDIQKTSVAWNVDIRTQGGQYIRAATISKYGKCISAYQTDIRIDQLSRYYGPGPWDVKVTRVTDDSESNSLQNDLYWSGYTKIINRVLIYPDTCLIGVTIDSQQFGSRVPSRSYEVYGIRCQIPSNYNPVDRSYTGAWDGTFQRSYTNNPAWVLYDLANNDRYGLGLDASNIDKWGLYTIAQYCDQLVDDSFGGTEPRFTFNGVLQTRTDVIHALNMICSNFRGMPYWAGGQLRVSQDSPKDSSKLVTAANVIEGMFTYSYSSIDNRYTICNVSWNDPDNFYKLTVEAVDDKEGLARYGYRPSDVTAIGCTSRGQAYRFGRWFLYTSLNETETITYRASWDHADVMPGYVITVMDNHEAATRAGGRLVSTTANTATLDNGVELEIGQTYAMTFIDPDGTLVERDVTTVPDNLEHVTVDLGGSWPGDEPQVDSVWILSASNVNPVDYRVVTCTEVEPNIFEITAVIYDPNKYATIEDGKLFAPIPITKVPNANTQLAPPTNIQVEKYTYEDTGGISERADRKTGVLLSWTHTRDTRFQNYEVQWKTSTGSFADNELIETTDNQYDIKPLEAADYTFRVRSIGMTRESVWLTLSEYTVTDVPNAPPNINGLQVKGGGLEWTGKDCEIEWDAMVLATDTSSPIIYDSTSPTHAAPFDSELTKIKDYQIEIMTQADVHLRYDFVTENSYKYLFNFNQLDNGTPIRNLKFRVWARDIFDQLSNSPAVIAPDNPAPDMGGLIPTVTDIFTGLKVDWSSITPSDTDLAQFKVYLDKSNPPTTIVAEVGRNTTSWTEPGLTAEDTYRVQIEPYDEFGAGTKSSVSSGVPLKIAAGDIDVELQSRLTITDSYDTTGLSNFEWMFDHKTDLGVASATYESGDWINVSFPTQQLVDRVSIWADKTFDCYFGISKDGGTTWEYFGGDNDASGNLTAGVLTSYGSSKASAITNKWTANAAVYAINIARFPNGLAMTDSRFFLLTNSTLMTELIFTDQVIAEWVVAAQLSAIAADIGTITAGELYSTNISATKGTHIDLNGDEIVLGGLVDRKIVLDGTTSTIAVGTGGTIAIGDSGVMTIGDEGKLLIGDDGFIRLGNNLQLDEVLNEDGIGVGQITISEDTALLPSGKLDLTGADYLLINEGGIFTYYWDQSTTSHAEYLNLVRLESGTANNNDTVNIPGLFKAAPTVMISPNLIKSYDKKYPERDQTFRLEVLDLQPTGDFKWSFRPRATLELAGGVFSTSGIEETVKHTSGTPLVIYSSPITLRDNTKRLSVSYSTHCISTHIYYIYSGGTVTKGGPCTWYANLQWRTSTGGWTSANSSGLIGYSKTKSGIQTPISQTYEIGLQSGAIYQFRLQVIVATFENKKWVSPLPDGYINGGLYCLFNIYNLIQDVATSNKISNGTVNWIAVGQ